MMVKRLCLYLASVQWTNHFIFHLKRLNGHGHF